MRRIIPTLIIALMLIGITSCNEKPREYQIVINTVDGKQQIEKLTAANDTVALNMYLDRMTKSIIAETEKDSTSIESMFILSPEGDTLNTNKELLMKAVEPTLNNNDMKIQVKEMKVPAPAPEQKK